jgi:toxin ParE1/3/4
MSYRVLLTDEALRDLEDIDDFITENDSPRRADDVLTRIDEAFNKLKNMPERGSHPKELLELGIREYREVRFKPYRIIYRIQGKSVYVYLIIDGRRDMHSLLSRRLLEP